MSDLTVRIPDKLTGRYNNLRVRVRDDTHSLNAPAHSRFVEAMVNISENHYEEFLTLLKETE